MNYTINGCFSKSIGNDVTIDNVITLMGNYGYIKDKIVQKKRSVKYPLGINASFTIKQKKNGLFETYYQDRGVGKTIYSGYFNLDDVNKLLGNLYDDYLKKLKSYFMFIVPFDIKGQSVKCGVSKIVVEDVKFPVFTVREFFLKDKEGYSSNCDMYYLAEWLYIHYRS